MMKIRAYCLSGARRKQYANKTRFQYWLESVAGIQVKNVSIIADPKDDFYQK